MLTAFKIHQRGRQPQIALGVLTFTMVLSVASSAKAEDATRKIETGSLPKDVVVAPVRRVFPKTPTDRELNRLSRTATAKAKSSTKRKKR